MVHAKLFEVLIPKVLVGYCVFGSSVNFCTLSICYYRFTLNLGKQLFAKIISFWQKSFLLIFEKGKLTPMIRKNWNPDRIGWTGTVYPFQNDFKRLKKMISTSRDDI